MWMRATQRLRAHLPTLAQCRREGAGGFGQFFLGGLFLKLGVLGSGRECLLEMGRACCIFMYPHHRKGCVSAEYTTGVGSRILGKRDPSGQKETSSRQKALKVGKSVLELGRK